MRKTNLTAACAAIALIGVSLASCGERESAMSNPKICANFNTTGQAQAATATDAATPVDNCVRRWAYSLAGSRDSADVIAEATVAACAGALTHWNQAGLQSPDANAGGPEQALSLVTGQPTTSFAEHNTFAHNHALLYVVEARAGRCAPPPVTNGAPSGT